MQRPRQAQFVLIVALAVNSAFAVALLGLRTIYASRFEYRFLIWNLFLAWIPVICAFALDELERRRAAATVMLAVGGVWLLFFPNSPYIVTDLIHLEPKKAAPLWLDALVLVSFAWAGVLCGFVALGLVQSLVRARWGSVTGWVFALAVLGLSSFGIYLGRFERWNSWDLIRRPRGLYRDVVDPIENPLGHPRTIAVTVLMAGFLLVTYAVFMAFAELFGTRRGPPGGRPAKKTAIELEGQSASDFL